MSKNEFILTENHILLLRASWVNERLSEVEYGAAEIDPKRPYGNSDVESDIARILGYEFIDQEYLRNSDRELCRLLHAETPLALQIVLSTGSFQPGVYHRTTSYGKDWKLVSGDNSDK